jgi:hypothetical protein
VAYGNDVGVVELLQEFDFSQGRHIQAVLHFPSLDFLDGD